MPRPATAATRRTIPPPPPFEIIRNVLPEDKFHKKLPGTGKGGYYQSALKALAEAKRGSVLRFPTCRPYGSVRNAAKKLGYELMFAKDGEAMLIQVIDTGSDK
jgi:hypothetical protein